MFQKGQSGNPGGRPKAVKALMEQARAHTAKAIAALVLALDDPKTRVPAAVALLDRGYGKPAQPVDGDGEGGPVRAEFVVEFVEAALKAKE